MRIDTELIGPEVPGLTPSEILFQTFTLFLTIILQLGHRI